MADHVISPKDAWVVLETVSDGTISRTPVIAWVITVREREDPFLVRAVTPDEELNNSPDALALCHEPSGNVYWNSLCFEDARAWRDYVRAKNG